MVLNTFIWWPIFASKTIKAFKTRKKIQTDGLPRCKQVIYSPDVLYYNAFNLKNIVCKMFTKWQPSLRPSQKGVRKTAQKYLKPTHQNLQSRDHFVPYYIGTTYHYCLLNLAQF